MVGLTQNLLQFADAVGDECQSLREKIGTLGDLTTTDKDNLVDAVNELRAALLAATSIDDTVTVANKTWSSSKVSAAIDAAIVSLVGNAPAALNTLQELAAALANNPNFATDFTALQANIGNVNTDFTAVFNQGLL